MYLVYTIDENGTITYQDARNIKISNDNIGAIERSYISKLVPEAKVEAPLEAKVEMPIEVEQPLEAKVDAETGVIEPGILYHGAKLSLMGDPILQKLREKNPSSASDLFKMSVKIKEEKAVEREAEIAADLVSLKELMEFQKEEVKEEPVALETKVEVQTVEEPKLEEKELASVSTKPARKNKHKNKEKHQDKEDSESKDHIESLEMMAKMAESFGEMQKAFEEMTKAANQQAALFKSLLMTTGQDMLDDENDHQIKH
jgi:hypothetical protein